MYRERMLQRITIEAIARAAGVSKATVSRVLGVHPERHDVRVATREKILRVAETLGWRGPALPKERPEAVLALVYEATEASPGEGVASAVAKACRAAGVVLTYEPVTRPVAAWRHRLEHHLQPSGILIVTPIPTDPLALAGLTCPMVVVNQRTGLALPHVLPDNEQAGALLGRRLFLTGHRQAIYLAPDDDFHSSVEDRARGLRQAGLSLIRHPVDAAEDVVERLRFRNHGRPTAVVAWSWLAAVETLFACHRHGLEVPHDLSVLAFDDGHVVATAHPPLTVVDPQHDLMATEAVRMVLIGERNRKEIRTSVRLIERLSDGPAPDR